MEEHAPQNAQHNQLDLGHELTVDPNIYSFIEDIFSTPTPTSNSAHSSGCVVHTGSAAPLTLSSAPYVNAGLVSLPSTPAAPSNLFSTVLPPPHPSSAPPPRLLSSNILGAPILLPPNREDSPEPSRPLQASPITPLCTPPLPQSAPCTPASISLSPVSPPLQGDIDGERFVPSSELSYKLLHRSAEEDPTQFFYMVLYEIKAFVDRLKDEKRDQMRDNPPHDRNAISPKERTRIRSRRGAAVSRFRVSRTIEALDEAATWCVEQFGAGSRPYRLPTMHIEDPSTVASHGNLLSSPRTQLASTIVTLSIGTSPGNKQKSSASSSHLAPLMHLPPAPGAPEGLVAFPPKMSGDEILRSVTRTPLANAENKQFVLSDQLQTALRERRAPEEVKDLVDRLRQEVKMFVEMNKGLVRDELKDRLNEVRNKLTPKSRMRGRSRRGAAVTRFKNTATIRAWEDALRWLVSEIKADVDHGMDHQRSLAIH